MAPAVNTILPPTESSIPHEQRTALLAIVEGATSEEIPKLRQKLIENVTTVEEFEMIEEEMDKKRDALFENEASMGAKDFLDTHLELEQKRSSVRSASALGKMNRAVAEGKFVLIEEGKKLIESEGNLARATKARDVLHTHQTIRDLKSSPEDVNVLIDYYRVLIEEIDANVNTPTEQEIKRRLVFAQIRDRLRI